MASHQDSQYSTEYIAPDDSTSSNTDDGDSDYASGTEDSTHSLLSSVYYYTYENGRRYHAYKEGAYAMPNDEVEQDRLDMTHHLYLLITGGSLFTVPIDTTNPPQRILDIGTGTGIWAVDMAEEFRSAEVIATDLSPIQPKWVPPNLRFEIDDAEDSWTWQKESFDYIHVRGLLGAIKDWPRLLKQAYDHLRPGGWLEVVEHDYSLQSDDNTYPEDCAIRRWFNLLNEAAGKAGRVVSNIQSIKDDFRTVGFENVGETRHKVPWGPWPKERRKKEQGAWVLMITESGFESFGMALMTRTLGMENIEVSKLCEEAFAELKTKKYHLYNIHYFLTGQKSL